MKHFHNISEIEADRRQQGKRYLEFLRVPAMSAGLYVLKAGDKDTQNPHREDEIYYVVRGRARMQVDDEDQPVSAGSVIFVEAHKEHRFHDIEEDLEILVLFAPAES